MLDQERLMYLRQCALELAVQAQHTSHKGVVETAEEFYQFMLQDTKEKKND